MLRILLTCAFLQSAIQSVPNKKVYDYGLIPYLVSRVALLVILLHMIFKFPFFLNKRVDNILALKQKIPLSHKLLVAWVYIIGFSNAINQLKSIVRSTMEAFGFDIKIEVFNIFELVEEIILSMTALSILMLH